MAREPPPLGPRAAQDWRARWDRQQARYIPLREERFDAILDALARSQRARFRALDLGCGTGSLSERVLARFPQAQIVAVDFDPITMRLGQTALGSVGGRLTWVDADLRRARWERALPTGRFDAAVSTTALHWLTGPELARLYRTLARLLRAGGIFLNGDSFAYAMGSRRLTRMARLGAERPGSGSSRAPPLGESWSEWWRAALRDPRLARESALHRARFPRGHERTPSPDLEGHLKRLRRAGFREVEVIWGSWRNRVLAAVR